MRISRSALDPRFQACDLVFVARSVDDQVADNGKISQRFDRHRRFDGFPAGENFTPVHPNGAGSAHLGPAKPAIGEIGSRVLGDPVEGIQDAHPLLVRHLEVLIRAAALGAANPHSDAIAWRQA